MDIKRPIVSYDLGNPIGDIAWAPYSSTVFAAVTSEGKLYILVVLLNFDCIFSRVDKFMIWIKTSTNISVNNRLLNE